MGEALLTLAHSVPLQVELGQGRVDPQQVAQDGDTAAGHVVAAQVEDSDTGVAHETLVTVTPWSSVWSVSNYLEKDIDGVTCQATIRQVQNRDGVMSANYKIELLRQLIIVPHLARRVEMAW